MFWNIAEWSGLQTELLSPAQIVYEIELDMFKVMWQPTDTMPTTNRKKQKGADTAVSLVNSELTF